MAKSIYWSSNGGVFTHGLLENCWEIHRDRDRKSANYVAISTLGIPDLRESNQEELKKRALQATEAYLVQRRARIGRLTERLEKIDWTYEQTIPMTWERKRDLYYGVLDGAKYKKTIITQECGDLSAPIYTYQGEIK